MESLQIIFMTFSLWFFTWHTIQSYMKQQKINKLSCYSLGLVISLGIYFYFNNVDKEDNV